jgi:hypothetical protein
MPADTTNEHHWKPKTFKGKDTALLHRLCHNKIHAVFTERELLRYYHTPERILENEEMQKFVEWVKTKPPHFYVSHKDSSERSRKRRR